jgi:hypothetical protein
MNQLKSYDQTRLSQHQHYQLYRSEARHSSKSRRLPPNFSNAVKCCFWNSRIIPIRFSRKFELKDALKKYPNLLLDSSLLCHAMRLIRVLFPIYSKFSGLQILRTCIIRILWNLHAQLSPSVTCHCDHSYHCSW